MGLNIQFVDAELNEDTKLTTVVLQYDDKKFYGYSKPADVDMEHFSKIRGGRIAELKAAKKAFNYIKAEKEKEMETCEIERKLLLIKDISNLEKGIKNFKKELNEIRNYKFDK